MEPMTNDLAPVHGINQYLWAMLKEALPEVMDPDRFNGWIPIIPTQQIERFTEMVDASDNAGGVPFIVYNWTTPTITQDWFIQTDQVTYLIYSQNETELRKISKVMVDLFKRWDDSGREVTSWVWANKDDRYKQFDYKTISVTSAGGALPLESEGGRQEALVAIRVNYTMS